ncbi:hypothetical protein [Rhizobium sp. GN54]|uniref:hypothetical protein n=1 Tax=Rhizobium sp. GN54 TaxID=2898150 RepID=UPI001E4B5727|nr:hypothetical protein [Rhizobium sp. GN54]MCD2180530.1 hypothetical protein [Rhizobium sp. GN54]
MLFSIGPDPELGGRAGAPPILQDYRPAARIFLSPGKQDDEMESESGPLNLPERERARHSA